MNRHAHSAEALSWAAAVSAAYTGLLWQIRAALPAAMPYLHSDAVYPFALARDLLGQGAPLAWTLPPAPYFVPDVALAALASTLIPSPTGQVVGFLVLVCAGVCLAMSFCARSVAVDWGTALAGPPLVLAWWFQAHLGEAAFSAATVFLLPAYHQGSLLMGLLLVGLSVRRRRTTRGTLLCTTVLVALASASDPLFLAQFVAPAAAASALGLRSAEHRRDALGMLLALGLGAGLAVGARAAIDASPWFEIGVVPGRRTSTAALRAFLSDRGPVLSELLAAPTALGIGSSALLALYTLGRRRPPEAPRASELRRLCVLLALALTFSAVAPVAAGVWRDARSVRYMLPVLLLPLVGVILMASQLVGWAATRSRIAAPVVMAALAAGAFFPYRPLAPVAFPIQPLVDRLDDIARTGGPRVGFADYFNAKLVTFLSREGVAARALTRDADIRIGINNANWYSDIDRDCGHESRCPLFVIADRLDLSRVRLRLGRPSRTEEIGDHRLLLYDAAPMESLRSSLDTAAQDSGFRTARDNYSHARRESSPGPSRSPLR